MTAAMASQQTAKLTRDVVYKNIDNEALGVDVYEPEEIRGAIVLIHGGGWFAGDKAKEEHLASRLVDEGFVVFVPNYRLAPKYLFPAGRRQSISVETAGAPTRSVGRSDWPGPRSGHRI